MKPNLYLVSTPIGNYDDITLRALKILKSVDFIICEEYKPARRLLAHFEIKKELISLNEHNEQEVAPEILQQVTSGKSAALISDSGTPLFSDPGHLLVELCIQNKIEVIPIPGVNSLLPALTGSGLDIEKFYYYGWLSQKKEIRRKELNGLKNLHELIVILDTPYRLKPLLEDVSLVFGAHKNIVIAFELTTEKEKFYRGSVSNISKEVKQKHLKGEFVLLLDNRKTKK